MIMLPFEKYAEEGKLSGIAMLCNSRSPGNCCSQSANKVVFNICKYYTYFLDPH